MDNPPEFISVFPSILTDFEDGLSVSSVKTAIEKKNNVLSFKNALITYLLYKCQWNTRWAFAQKQDIFRSENNMLSYQKKEVLWQQIDF